jgi:hypothetical protein
MLWELLRYPSDDPHAQVYWRRRVSVLAVVAVVALLMVVLLFRGGGSDSVTPTAAERPAATAGGPAPGSPAPGSPAPGGPAAAGSASPTASPSPSRSTSPSPSATPVASGAAATRTDPATTCAPGSMALRVASDAPSYPAGASPVLTLSVVDVGTAPCVVDLGTTATSLTVLSGGKPVWSSNACGARTPRPVQLTPAAAQMLQQTWDRTRNVNSCSGPSALPAGQYEVVARVGNSAVYGGSLVLS